ncbi:hypothetical protein M747DRAFT_5243 [Aspergillus niger ATCC 13496]|uniref:Uncharacterized protein n=1 Tax=Aspergillus niger ATCC 13496 TaxID=1353008 RepID=A0A370CDP7_ASPNG|nr:hypothetical protein M747DRAFT_5243 [Aspergillus niger ATCC 13496]
MELVRTVQDHWIGFIVESAVQKFSDAEVLVWGEDGNTRIESLDETSRWVERKSRLEVLGRDVASIMRVFWALCLAVIGSRFVHMRLYWWRNLRYPIVRIVVGILQSYINVP